MTVNGYKDKESAVQALSRYIDFKLQQTTLFVERANLNTDISYYLSYRSDFGCVMFRLVTVKGVKWLNPYELSGLREISAYLITWHCSTKYKNKVDGWKTVNIYAKEEPSWVFK